MRESIHRSIAAIGSVGVGETTGAEDKFRALLESALGAMVMVGIDDRIALVNSQSERLFGAFQRCMQPPSFPAPASEWRRCSE